MSSSTILLVSFSVILLFFIIKKMFKLIILAIVALLGYFAYLKYFPKEDSKKGNKIKTSFIRKSEFKKNYITSLIALLFIVFQASTLFAQSKENNRIILWDVTASMVGSTKSGYDAKHDIDKNVRESLRKLIKDFDDDNSIIRIFPFTTIISDYSKQFTCNSAGKAAAIKFITGYYIDPKIKGFTNICSAWEMAHKYIDKAKSNYIYLYTDGEQNINYGEDGKNCMQGLIDKYCAIGACYTYFISIDAVNNKINFPANCGKTYSVEGGHPFENPKSLNLSILNNSIVHNLQDGLSQVLRFKEIGNRKLNGFVPTGKLIFSNSAYSFDVKLTLVKEYEDGTADFKLSFIDYTENTVKRLKSITKLNENAALTFESSDSEVTFDPVKLDILFNYEKPKPVQKVTIKID